MSRQPIWSTTVTTRWAWGVFASALVAAVVIGRIGIWPASVVLFAVAVVVLAFTKVEVTVDAAGLSLRYGPGWPVQHFPAARIEGADSLDLADLPIDRGFWGYKGSVRILGRAQLNLFRGPALELRLVGGRRFTVTVPDPDAAVAALSTVAGPGADDIDV